MSRLPELNVNQIEDTYTRENFRRLVEFLKQEYLFLGFRSFEVEFKAAETNHKFSHNLGVLPKDVIVTSTIGPGTVSFNAELSTSEVLNITVTDAVIVRFIAGTFK
jgi:hypothetical protein